MLDDHAGARLHGRRRECQALDRLLADLRAGQSQVLRLHIARTLLVVNAAEGKPGTSKDWAILNEDPYLVLDGALIAAHAPGRRAQRGSPSQSWLRSVRWSRTR
jgi:hypothetical protein